MPGGLDSGAKIFYTVIRICHTNGFIQTPLVHPEVDRNGMEHSFWSVSVYIYKIDGGEETKKVFMGSDLKET